MVTVPVVVPLTAVVAVSVGDDAAAPTWGITGSQFLAAYWTALVALCFLAGWASFGRPSVGVPAGTQLTAEEAAMLVGGRYRAVQTALAGISAEGSVEHQGDGFRLTAPAGATALQRALATEAGRVAPRKLVDAPLVRMCTTQIADSLQERGLSTPRLAERAALFALFGTMALWVFGWVRFAAGVANGQPVGFLLATQVVMWIVWLMMIYLHGSLPERAGRTLADGLMQPGRSGVLLVGAPVAVSVALHGDLGAADPLLARQVAAPQSGGGDSGSSGGGGDSGGCGGGCGGCGG